MGGAIIVVLTAVLAVVGLGGAVFAFSGPPAGASKKRVAALARSPAANAQVRTAALTNQQRRKSVQQLLKDLERQQSEQKQRPTLQRRISRAGLQISPRTFWLMSGVAAVLAAAISLFTHQPIFVAVLAAFGIGLGFPRWVLWFLTKRRQKKFTNEFANGIDVIVRSVKSGLPANEALKIVAREIPEPVAGEFNKLCEGLKVGVTLEQGLKRMYENMPTPEVNFFGIVMTVQLKSGGNLSEALGNLAAVLRERKRLQGKIKALSAEAKASAMIIGSLPPAVMAMVYYTTPNYIEPLFNTRVGNLMLAGCAVWMAMGIFIMKKMISFKH
ncbi:MAG TPA: type II secretion system F family protein [Rhizomicrobium sp.]|jgi:tight adherence protein B|nr:type II secretion system F family protein [Rhizomicrobium sp.]